MRQLMAALPLLLLVPFGAAQAQVPGSYQRSCRQIAQNGSILSAVCQGSNGRYSATTLDLDRCGNQGVSNNFGRLACGSVVGSSRPAGNEDGDNRGGYRNAPPRDDADNGDGYAPPRRRYVSPDQDDGYAPPPPPRRRYNTYDNDD